MPPRTRDQETEWFQEAGTFDHMDEPEYEPDDTDPDFDLSDDEELTPRSVMAWREGKARRLVPDGGMYGSTLITPGDTDG